MLSTISLYVVSSDVILGIFVLHGVLISLIPFMYFLAMRLLITPQDKKTIKRNRCIGISNLLVTSTIIWVLININDILNVNIMMAMIGIGMVLLSTAVLRQKGNSQNQYSMPIK